ncbi:MAG: RraA family protein [Rhodobacteraceae bacterium]|nr:RraA family protein [Paracoccaceae bacterium]
MAKSTLPASGQEESDPIVAEMRDSFFVSLVSDVLDSLGHTRLALPAGIRPLDESLKMVGRARTMLYADVYSPPGSDENHYELEIRLVDSLRPGEIAVAACGRTGRIAPWGGLLSTASIARGASGALMDGYVRDILHIRSLKFPVFAAGIAPLDSNGRGKVIETDVTVEVGGVPVSPGDLVFGDADGCIVIPRELEDAVVAAGREKLAAEHKTVEALMAGRMLEDVFEEFGVL